jgi:hypothetical protein
VASGHNDFFKVVRGCVDRSRGAEAQHQPEPGGAEAKCILAH